MHRRLNSFNVKKKKLVKYGFCWFVNNIYLVKLMIINSNQFRATEFGCVELVLSLSALYYANEVNGCITLVTIENAGKAKVR